LEEIIFEIFNISEINIISVELAKVLGYVTHCQFQNDEVVAQLKEMKALNFLCVNDYRRRSMVFAHEYG
jgi:hypothetical protein